jgi:hypothetical protein
MVSIQKLLVNPDRFYRGLLPGEVLKNTFPAGITHVVAQLFIAEQTLEGNREVIRVRRRYQEAGFAIFTHYFWQGTSVC